MFDFRKFKPLNDRVLVKRVETEEITESGLIIPDTAKEKAQTGTVVAIGTGRRETNGVVTPLAVRVGDIVYFGKYAGAEAGKDHLIIREDEILGVVENS